MLKSVGVMEAKWLFEVIYSFKYDFDKVNSLILCACLSHKVVIVLYSFILFNSVWVSEAL